MVESKFPCSYYAKISNINAHYPLGIFDIELRRDSPVRIGISLTQSCFTGSSTELKGGLRNRKK